MIERPLILVTNDDGADSPGLVAAARAAARLGKVLVAAPVGQQTAMGRSYPKGEQIGTIREQSMAELPGTGHTAYAIEGSPAQVVSYAVLELADRMPDLCISGVNFGENLGTTLTGSGTVGAAFEADSYGVPSLAISLQVAQGDTPESVDWTVCETVTERFGRMILDRGLPDQVSILNINVPTGASQRTAIVRTIDSRQPFWVFRKPVRLDRNTPARLLVEAELIESTLEPESDIHALVIRHCISVTPLNKRMAYEGDWTAFPSGL